MKYFIYIYSKTNLLVILIHAHLSSLLKEHFFNYDLPTHLPYFLIVHTMFEKLSLKGNLNDFLYLFSIQICS